MLVLYETAMGYCLFKVGDPAKVESDDLWKEFESPEKASKLYAARELQNGLDTDFYYSPGSSSRRYIDSIPPRPPWRILLPCKTESWARA
jgi:hypothetical protein